MPVLHIYGQSAQHSEAYLLGNREGLTKLRDAIDRAIQTGEGWHEAFVNDGEGFATIVVCRDRSFTDPWWQNIARPYTDEYARDTRPEADGPWSMADRSYAEIRETWNKQKGEQA